MNPGPVPLNPPITAPHDLAWGLVCVGLGIFILVAGRIRHRLPWSKPEQSDPVRRSASRTYGPIVEIVAGVVLILGGLSLMLS